MKTLFDFEAIRALFASGFRMRFDAMHAVTGPYAHAIFERELGAPAGTVVNGTPLHRFRRPSSRSEPDLRQGPLRADDVAGRARFRRGLRRRRRPQPHHRAEDVRDAVRLAGDARRQRRISRRAMRAASPASRARCRPAARPTSVAKKLGIRAYETPTGWKFFGNLLDAGLATLCGEESSGTGSNHIREKDGVWAVLLWLNILARRQISVIDLAREHWRTYGRNYYTRHDYDEIDLAAAQGLMAALREATATLPGRTLRRADRRGGRRLRLSRSGRRLGLDPSGHPSDVRRRLAHRLPAVGHRHRRGDARASTSSATSRPPAISGRTPRPRSPT